MSCPSAGRGIARRRRVLVLDDIPEICRMYEAVFKRLGASDVDLTVETDPQVAIRLLRETTYDVVVSDFRMKGADGIDVLAAAREADPECRRVLMTGYNEIPATLDRIRIARVDAYLQKPLRTQEILTMMSALIEKDPDALAEYRARAAQIEANVQNGGGPPAAGLS